jgi:hypothetical protein
VLYDIPRPVVVGQALPQLLERDAELDPDNHNASHRPTPVWLLGTLSTYGEYLCTQVRGACRQSELLFEAAQNGGFDGPITRLSSFYRLLETC